MLMEITLKVDQPEGAGVLPSSSDQSLMILFILVTQVKKIVKQGKGEEV